MTLLISLLLLVFIALALVNYVNQWHERQRLLQMRVLRLRKKAEVLEEVMVCLESTLPDRDAAREINQEIIGLLKEIEGTGGSPNERVEAAIANAEERARVLSTQKAHSNVSYRKESDAKIAQTQHHLNEAAKILRQRFSQGRLSEDELNTQLRGLAWASLMVSAASFIGQGAKASLRGDIFSAHAFYKKAQHLLIGSSHPNPERMRLIRELSELINGERADISPDLLPEETLE